ncbi:hypothetical protein HGP16_08835 [Rhizobium sp. P40RR-XXII]|uniref:hypothetical protein n=1 Tax=unclassified Rhizobium TaxID=2613769 RepID=UPI0014573F68|nr:MULTISPECIES: hypothetical protein [unclassified Rhizobium]NLR84429.1 hypothetical protein [Rhizobium sp. P28RR-XV]NLS16664.1 hypothetical protein [Rhizobium sp. P40RR-XXII]
MDTQFSGFEIFAPKIDAAWAALHRQYASHLTGTEIDHLFACSALVGTKLPSDRAPILHPFRSRRSYRAGWPSSAKAKPSAWGAYFRKCTILQSQGQTESDLTGLASRDGFRRWHECARSVDHR